MAQAAEPEPAAPIVKAPPPATPAAFRTYAARTLELDEADVWGLGDLDRFDWQRLWASLGLEAAEPYAAWYAKQKRALRMALQAAGQSPRNREETAQ